MNQMPVVFVTERLRVRRARDKKRDVDFYYRLWNTPEVMIFVGFPKGLRISREQVRKSIVDQAETEFDTKLLIELIKDQTLIGECKLGSLDQDLICQTDIKLLPRFWNRGYGTEVKQGLVDYLFTHTSCKAVKATPNILNMASQKMQEHVGGKKIGQELFRFPEHMRHLTTDVHCLIYVLERRDWEQRKTDR